MSRTIYLFDEWPENSPIGWWNEGRKKLNIVVRRVNAWQIEREVDRHEATVILAMIDLGKRSWAAEDGGSDWLDELVTMETFVRNTLSSLED